MNTRSSNGCFVVLEGLDGAGTTTQAERLASRLRKAGYAVLVTREPSDGPVGTLLRHALAGRVALPHGKGALSNDTLALLFAADRTDHLCAEILPALSKGQIVLCDRYLLSSFAYQGATLPIQWVESINSRAPKPDLTLFIDVKPQVAKGRRAHRGATPELFEGDSLQRKIARQYALAIRRLQKRHRIVRVDGSRSIEEITAQAFSEVLKRLSAPGSESA